MTESTLSGLLVVDKPVGLSSHSVVARVRRKLAGVAAGHAGTLDPGASGVLLVLVGECTKLSRYLVLDHKSYDAVVRLGELTDTLDADGAHVDAPPVSLALRQQLIEAAQGRPSPLIESAIAHECVRTSQIPPAHSAIKQAGQRAYQRARRGEVVDLPPRDVRVTSLQVTALRAEPSEIDLSMTVSKGYYVRSLARDLGDHLGCGAHLRALRRTQSGDWSLTQAVSLDVSEADMMSALVPVVEVAKALMPTVILSDAGTTRALHGQTMREEDFVESCPDGVSAWLDPSGRLVAVGERNEQRTAVMRVFAHPLHVC